MKPLSTKRIHISPVGFEIDRVVEPAIADKADMVYLLMHVNRSEDDAIPYSDKISKILKKKGIESKIVLADRFDLFDIIRVVKEIIQNDRKSDFYINVASGSKIHAIGCMIACMIFDDRTNLKPFYAIAENYPVFKNLEQQTTGVKMVQQLPTYRILTPEKQLLQALTVIKEVTEKNRDHRITKKELVRILEEKEVIKVGGELDEDGRFPINHKMSKYTTLDKKIIKPLQKWGYVDQVKEGKNMKIFLTEDGKDAAKFLF